MLNIILGTDRKYNSARILKDICAGAKEAGAGRFLVVPEQFSHMTERALCRAGGDTISRYAEVLGFSRLASRVFALSGGGAEEVLDGGGKLLLMSLAVEQVRSRLKIYGSCGSKPEFLLQLLDTLDEFHSFCVTPEHLRKAARSLSGALAQKLEEFALLMESYGAVCTAGGRNPDTVLNRLLSALETGNFARGKSFYFDGFTDFNGVQLEIIGQLLESGGEVTVSLTCDSLTGGGQQFEAARATARSLLSLWPEHKLVTLEPEACDTPLSALRRHLFTGTGQTLEEPQDQIRWFTAPDGESLCRYAAGELLALEARGVRWRQCAVACCDDSLRPVLRSIFARGGIPLYDTGDRDILREPVIHMLLAVLEAAAGAMLTEHILDYLKSGFAPITPEDCDEVENYALLWRLEGNRWEQPWTMNPYGFRRPMDEEGQALLNRIESARARAMEPLLALSRGLRKAGTTGEMVLALYGFTEDISLNEKLNDLALACHAGGRLQRMQEYTQIYGILCGVLEQMYSLAGRSVRSPEEFRALFQTMLSQYQVGTIPAVLDAVSVGSLMDLRHSDVDYMFVLGAREGCFPCSPGGGSLLTDQERSSLLSLGLGVSPAAEARLDREMAVIDGVLSAPRKALILGAQGEQEAYLFRRAARLFPTGELPRENDNWTLRCREAYLAYLAGRCEAPTDELTQEAFRLHRAGAYTFGPLTAQGVRELYGTRLRLSSSKVDTLAGCPFRYFLQYGLLAREQEAAELSASVYGTFVHYVLEKTAAAVVEEGGFPRVSQARTLELARAFMEQYAREELEDLMEDPREVYLFRRTFREVEEVVGELHRELSQSGFQPRWFELHFARGEEKGMDAISVGSTGGRASLEGYVDRVDLWKSGQETYVRVVDYKTGEKDFDYELVLNGIGLQMLLYLFALSREGETLGQGPLHPAGVLYFPARVKQIPMGDRLDEAQREKKRISSNQRKGLLLDNEQVLQAMEPYEESPVYLPFKVNAKGERKGNLATGQELRALERYVFRTVGELSDRVFAGQVAPAPYYKSSSENACRYCPYGEVCRSQGCWRAMKKAKNPEEFWSQVEGAENG